MKLFVEKPMLHNQQYTILAFKMALLLVVLCFIFFESSIPAIEIDDAYISFRYARNFVNGNGLVFNVGEHVEGYSNFLWVILLTMGSRIGFDVPLFAKWAGVFFALLSLFFCILILKRDNNRPAIYFLGETFVLSILILSFPSILYWASGTLETPLFMFSLVFAVWTSTLKSESFSTSMLKGMGMALPSFVRFDGIIFSLILVLYESFKCKEGISFREVILPIILCIVLVGSYHIWRVGYYDSFLPNTVIVKGSTGFWRLLRGGVSYMVDFVTVNNIPVFFIPVLFVWKLRLGFSRAEQLLICFVFIYSGFIVGVRGDCMVGHRYATALIPLIVLLGISATGTIHSRFSAHIQPRFYVLFLMIPLILAPIHVLGYYSRDFHKRYKWTYGRDYRIVAEYLIKNNLGNTSLAIGEPGISGYFFPGKIIDTWGLTDKAIALIKKKHKIPITSIIFGDDAVPENRGNAKKEIAEYILLQRPTAIYGFPYGLSKDRLEKFGYKEVIIEGVKYPLLINFSKQN
ncbi:MAG: hypothetical protein JSW00_13765 [Thermoplasmata archaeon]|nr:MAG: hypothetical protein JSW00_13765 [Thermoplasmata archaeon]